MLELVGMKTIAWLPLVLVVTLASACESGWDVEGRVVTSDAPDKARPIYLYTVDAETIDLASFRMAADSIQYLPMKSAPAIPPDELPFATFDFGCHRGSFAMVAWAPPAASLPPASTDDRRPFTPQPGDYVAFSGVRHPYCGMRSHPEHIELVLDGQTFPVP